MFKIVKTFYQFFSKRKIIFVFFLFLILISSLADSIEPYFYKLLVNNIIISDYPRLSRVIISLISLKFISLILFIATHFIGDVLLINSAIQARVSVFKKIQDLDFYFHTQKSSGSLISAIKRGDGAFFTFSHVIHFNFLRIIISFVVMVAFFSSIDIRIVVISLISFILSILISFLLVSLNMKIRNQFNEEEDKISGIIVDNITNYDTVKLFARENWETNRLRDSFIVWKKRLWGYANSFRLIDFSIGSLINISIFFLLFYSFSLIRENSLPIGDFVLIVGFTGSFYPRIWEFVYSLRDLAKNFSDIQKYFGILDYSIEVKDPKKPVLLNKVKGRIKFNSVTFSYKDGQKNALKDVDIEIKPGESVALVGKSGSGKTTLIKLILRFYDLEKGNITIDGFDIKKFKKSDLRSFFGVVPQEPILFNDTIYRNIGYAKDNIKRKEIISASKLALTHDFINKLPKGYETVVGERGVKLSGGQKQRVAIARVIVSSPDIIIFDEATSQLDSESERLIQKAFWDISKGKTTIVIAHRLSTAMKADRIIVMDKGRIIDEGTHQELIAKKDGQYKKFWDLQTIF